VIVSQNLEVNRVSLSETMVLGNPHQEKNNLCPERLDALDALDALDTTCLTYTQFAMAP